jgi:hypothetical protein
MQCASETMCQLSNGPISQINHQIIKSANQLIITSANYLIREKSPSNLLKGMLFKPLRGKTLNTINQLPYHNYRIKDRVIPIKNIKGVISVEGGTDVLS